MCDMTHATLSRGRRVPHIAPTRSLGSRAPTCAALCAANFAPFRLPGSLAATRAVLRSQPACAVVGVLLEGDRGGTAKGRLLSTQTVGPCGVRRVSGQLEHGMRSVAQAGSSIISECALASPTPTPTSAGAPLLFVLTSALPARKRHILGETDGKLFL